MNPSTAAARWRKIKKLLREDALDLFLGELQAADWALAADRDEGLVLASLAGCSPKCATWVCENAPSSELERLSFAGQTPLALACKNASSDRLGETPARILLHRTPSALLTPDANGVYPSAFCAQAQAWELLERLAQEALTLSVEQRTLSFFGPVSMLGALRASVRHHAPARTMEQLLSLFPQLSPEQAFALLKEAAWVNNAPCVPQVLARLGTTKLPKLAEDVITVLGGASPSESTPVVSSPATSLTALSIDDIDDFFSEVETSPQPPAPPIAAVEEDELKASLLPPLPNSGRDPVLVAFRQGHIDTVRAFLAGSLSVHNTDVMGRGALHAAILSRSLDLITLAIEAGVDVHLRDTLGLTPFLLACLHFCEPTVLETLHQAGAHLHEKSARERGAVDLACAEGSVSGLRWLVDKNLSISRSPTQAFGPMEHALCSSIEPLEKVEFLLSKGVGFTLADASCFLNPAGAPRQYGNQSHSGFGNEMLWRWTMPQAQIDRLRKSAKEEDCFDLSSPFCSGSTSLSAAVSAPSDRPLKLLVSLHRGSFSHWDFLGAWMRAWRYNVASRLQIVEDAWVEHEKNHPFVLSTEQQLSLFQWAPHGFFAPKQQSVDTLEETGRIAFRMGKSLAPPVAALQHSVWSLYFGVAFLKQPASPTRALLARRIDWMRSGFWGAMPEGQASNWVDLEGAQIEFGINETHQTWSRRIQDLADFLEGAGREELTQHIQGAQCGPFPVRSLWTFVCALVLAHKNAPPKHVLILVRQACEALALRCATHLQLSSHRGSVAMVGHWQEQLPMVLRAESETLFEALDAHGQAQWRRKQKNKKSPDIFQSSPWRTACERLQCDWLKLLTELGFPGRLDSQSLSKSALWAARSWASQREYLREAQEKLSIDSRLHTAFECIAQTQASKSFSASDAQGCGPLFFCFEARAWSIALAHGAHLVLTAQPDSETQSKNNTDRTEPRCGPSALTALLRSHPLDQLPAGSFRAASEARTPDGRPLLSIRGADGQLPFSMAFKPENLTREAQRRLASLWKPTLDTGTVSDQDASALLARALGDGFHDVARVMVEHGARLEGGGAPLTGAIFRLAQRADNVLLSAKNQSNPGAKADCMPPNNRLALIAQQVRDLGMDPFEPVGARGRVGNPGADYHPGATPLFAALCGGQFELALALLNMGAKPQAFVPFSGLSGIHLSSRGWFSSSLNDTLDNLPENSLVSIFAAFCLGAPLISDRILVPKTLEALHAAGLDLSEQLNGHPVIEFLRNQPTWLALAERLSLQPFAPVAPLTGKPRRMRL